MRTTIDLNELFADPYSDKRLFQIVLLRRSVEGEEKEAWFFQRLDTETNSTLLARFRANSTETPIGFSQEQLVRLFAGESLGLVFGKLKGYWTLESARMFDIDNPHPLQARLDSLYYQPVRAIKTNNAFYAFYPGLGISLRGRAWPNADAAALYGQVVLNRYKRIIEAALAAA